MTNASASAILLHLEAVARFRREAAAHPGLADCVQTVKVYQHARFGLTYADLLSSREHAPAARFFLNELYGPHDFTARDAQFARIVPALVRLFPVDIVETVRSLAELHALSERLDLQLARTLMPAGALDCAAYLAAWQGVGEASARDAQIELMLKVGRALVRFTRNPLLRHSLRLMRGPARAAGLGALQQFLESGFDTFAGLQNPAAFLDLIASRERAMVSALFAATSCEGLPAEFRQAENASPG
jgi:hypothetical protein